MSEEKKHSPEDHPVFARVKTLLASSGVAEKKGDVPAGFDAQQEYLSGSLYGDILIDASNTLWIDKLDDWSKNVQSFVKDCTSYTVRIGLVNRQPRPYYSLTILVWGSDKHDNKILGRTA